MFQAWLIGEQQLKMQRYADKCRIVKLYFE